MIVARGTLVRFVVLACGSIALAACGSDIASRETAQASRDNADSRAAAHPPKIYNPDVMMCVSETATADEKTALAEGGARAESAMVAILNRDETRQCMRENNVVIYL